MTMESITIPAIGEILPAGEVTIKLSDASTGVVEVEQKKKNFVHAKILKGIAEMLARHPFSFANGAIGLKNNYFNGIVLTDFAGVADPETENFFKGTRIAEGLKDQGASGTKRGAWNAAESVISSEYVKLVFDFSTSQGNGTFQSIYSAELINTTGTQNIAPYEIMTFVLPFTFSKIRKSGNRLFLGNGNKLYVYENMASIHNANRQLLDAYTEYTLPRSISSFVVRGDNLYYLVNSSIYRVILGAGTLTETLIKAVGFNCTNIADGEQDDRTYIQNNVTNNVHVFDLGWMDLRVISSEGLGGTSELVAVLENERILKKSSYLILTDSVEMYNHSSASSSNFVEMAAFPTYTVASKNSGANILTILSTPHFFSRALLDQPVTKTAQQNMKITYEFNIPKLDLTL